MWNNSTIQSASEVDIEIQMKAYFVESQIITASLITSLSAITALMYRLVSWKLYESIQTTHASAAFSVVVHNFGSSAVSNPFAQHFACFRCVPATSVGVRSLHTERNRKQPPRVACKLFCVWPAPKNGPRIITSLRRALIASDSAIGSLWSAVASMYIKHNVSLKSVPIT